MSFPGRWLRTVVEKARGCGAYRILPDGMRILCFAPHNPISVHDLKTGEEKTLIENAKGEWIKASWHPNGESVVCLSANGMIAFFAPSAKIFYKSVNLQLRRVNDFCLSPAGDEILVSTDSGQCFVKSFPVSKTSTSFMKTENGKPPKITISPWPRKNSIPSCHFQNSSSNSRIPENPKSCGRPMTNGRSPA